MNFLKYFILLFLVPVLQGNRRFKRDTVRDQTRRWPGGRVPYVFDQNTGYQTRRTFNSAIKAIEKVSCVLFVPRTYEYDYVKVITGQGCYSMIGKQGGMQELSLGDGCYRKGISIHETMHLLGFFHEQSRPDRDDHVTIHRDHVLDDAKGQFRKYRHQDGDTLGERYDPDSIMHYDNKAFSKNGRSTITYNRDPWKRLGQREKLSKTDIRQLNKLYRCKSEKKNTIQTTPSTSISRDNRSCRDNFWTSMTGECSFNAFMGLCSSRRMAEYCPKSCGYCPRCIDTSSYCYFFLSYGYCVDNETVRKSCQKTCGIC